MKKKLKIIGLITLLLFIMLGLSGCNYNPPEGYTEENHTYEELLEYAKSIDPNATVEDEYEDFYEEYRTYRVYPAVINGIQCGVSSSSKNIYDSDWGEYAKIFYRMDTDYDYYIIQDVLEKYPELGEIKENSVSYRFQINDIISSTIELDEIDSKKLDEIYNKYVSMKEELQKYPLHKKYWIDIYVNGKNYRLTATTVEEKEKVYNKMIEDEIL